MIKDIGSDTPVRDRIPSVLSSALPDPPKLEEKTKALLKEEGRAWSKAFRERVHSMELVDLSIVVH